jgi:hypothetical protein
MVDRKIILAENGRAAYRGVYQSGQRDYFAYQSDADDLSYTIDASPLLGDATISSVTRSGDGLTISGTSNTTTTATQRLKGHGTAAITITDNASGVHVVRIEIRQRQAEPRVTDYA